MGLILNFFRKKKEFNVLFQGLPASGKTSILYKFKLNKIVETIPTQGFNVERVRFQKIEFLFWDIGGKKNLRE